LNNNISNVRFQQTRGKTSALALSFLKSDFVIIAILVCSLLLRIRVCKYGIAPYQTSRNKH